MSLLNVTGIIQEERGERILHDLNFTIEEFQHTAIMGETGSGKTSLLKILAGFVSPVEGDVFFNGERLLRIPEEKLIQGHKGIAYLNQQSELPGFLTVDQVLEYANNLAEEEALRVYEICRINHLLKRRTDQLSGGEKQRIAIARLLTTSPRLLLLDEPFSNLDTIHKDLLKKILFDVGEQLKITCVMIAHDPQDTLSWAKQLIVMRNGRIIQQGSPREIYFQPVDLYTTALGGAFNFIAEQQSESFLKLWGYEGVRGNLVVRPEQVSVSTDTDDPVFVISAVRFYGPYQRFLAVKDEHRLQVTVGHLTFKSGDKVRLHVDAGAFHFLG